MGLDADGDNRRFALGQAHRVQQHTAKPGLVRDHMVGRQDGHHGIFRAATDQRGSQRHGGTGVPSTRLADDVTIGQFRQLFAY